MARYAVPGYIAKREQLIQKSPLGHRFLLYFKGWNIGNDEKRELREQLTAHKTETGVLLMTIATRQLSAAQSVGAYMLSGRLTSPFVTGMGNPHPVENGFSFLTPYGIPYLPGSSIKGIVRRAAEELALMNDDSPWTIPLVWALFGFEAGSAYLTEIGDHLAEGWCEEFEKWINEKADEDKLLKVWLDIICPDKDRKPDEPERSPSEILLSWIGDKGKNARKEIHWKGLLRFWDAFPSGDVKLDVDIMNPHHGEYLNGNGSPHDSEQPVPIFFLVMKSGADFNFYVESEDRYGLLDRVGDWKSLVSEAFNYAFDWLGFGAKTAVGYGAMQRDLDAEDRIEAERAAAEVRRKEEEKRRKEAEEKARLEAELEALPEVERLVRMIENANTDQKTEQFVNTECLPKLDEISGEDLKKLALAMKGFYERMGKWNVNKKRKKQYKKVQKIRKVLGESE
jgi:CRISPR-associated protein Cmr6